LVKQVIQYHIISDYAVLPELVTAGEVQSLEGQPIKITGPVSVSIGSLFLPRFLDHTHISLSENLTRV